VTPSILALESKHGTFCHLGPIGIEILGSAKNPVELKSAKLTLKWQLFGGSLDEEEMSVSVTGKNEEMWEAGDHAFFALMQGIVEH